MKIYDVMSRANFSDTYTRVVNGKKVVVRKGWKKRRRNIAIAAGAIGTTVGVLALLAARKKSSRLPTIPAITPKPPVRLPVTTAKPRLRGATKPQLPPVKPQPPAPPSPLPAPAPKRTRRTQNEKALDQWRQKKVRKNKEQMIAENTQTFLKGFKQAFMD
jgi:hypothetical protein